MLGRFFLCQGWDDEYGDRTVVVQEGYWLLEKEILAKIRVETNMRWEKKS